MPRNLQQAYPQFLVADGAILHGRPAEAFGVHVDAPAAFNQQALQAAITAGGLVTLITPGAYPITADTFSGSAGTTRVVIGPGVTFTISGTPTIITSLNKFRRRDVEILGMQHAAATKTDADAIESAALYALDIDANVLGANSALRIVTLWRVTNSAATKRVRGRFGGVVLWNLDLTTVNSYQYEFILRNRNSKAAQVANPLNNASFSTFSANDPQTFTIDFATAQQFTVTGQFPVAGAGTASIVLESVIVEHLPGD